MPKIMPRISLVEPRQLLVEGRDEELFFDALTRYLGIDNLQIENYQGKDKLRPYLRAFVATPGFDRVETIAVVRDADSNARSALQSVQDSLEAVNLPPPRGELISTGSNPSTIVLILPGNSEHGALEDICLRALEMDPAMDCVSAFMDCVSRSVSSPPQNPSKARIHAFLASREDPELRLGEAAQRGYLTWESPAFEQIKQLLTMM